MEPFGLSDGHSVTGSIGTLCISPWWVSTGKEGTAVAYVNDKELKALEKSRSYWNRRACELEEALDVALAALEEARGNINPERGFADELEGEINEALDKGRTTKQTGGNYGTPKD